jgi:Sigma-70, region 4
MFSSSARQGRAMPGSPVSDLTPHEMKPTERQVLGLRYGLFDELSRSLRDVGLVCGHSGEWARQVESAAIRRLLILARAHAAGVVLSASQRADLFTLYPAWLAWQVAHPVPAVIN